LCEIQAASHPVDVKLSISFIQLNNYLLQVESICFGVDEPLHWKPHIKIWSLHQKDDNPGKLTQQCKILGESDYFADWISNLSLLDGVTGHGGKTRTTSQSIKNENNEHSDDEIYDSVYNRQTVSSSMVLSENLLVPHAIVYGFFSGEIEVVQFDMLLGPEFYDRSPDRNVNSYVSRQFFSGHTGAVLCLAAHRMLATAAGSFNQVLVSGSMDCTVRI